LLKQWALPVLKQWALPALEGRVLSVLEKWPLSVLELFVGVKQSTSYFCVGFVGFELS
jgi:hypothetical protein